MPANCPQRVPRFAPNNATTRNATFFSRHAYHTATSDSGLLLTVPLIAALNWPRARGDTERGAWLMPPVTV